MKFKDFFHRTISEDFVDSLELKGDWTNDKAYGWDKPSRKLLTNKTGVERIKKLWDKSPQPFKLFMLKGPKVHKHLEVGEVDEQFVKSELNLSIPSDPNAITVIYTNNKGNNKIPTTAWTLAHRFGHALARKGGGKVANRFYISVADSLDNLFAEIANICYGIDLASMPPRDPKTRKIKRELCYALGTFKSARDRNIGNEMEFTNEVIAQYLITGNITFKRDIPSLLPLQMQWGKPSGPNVTNFNKALVDQIITRYERIVYYQVDQAVNSAMGKIFVM